jgi:hypothetical protein
MRNIFELTKREQRIVIVIIVALVAFAFGKHYLRTKSRPLRERVSSAKEATEAKPTSSPIASPTTRPQDEQSDEDDQ